MVERCKKCGYGFFELKPNGPHVGAYCGRCGSWIKWMPKKEVVMKLPQNEIKENIVENKGLDEVLNDEVPW